ncbi:major royal jelly-related protein [Marinomonas sp. S3726]|uniref:L-dopachrome tautomerase-related protein n=1 Tax=Marinomonas sp. S3726 TaxID=579484 RepID=UPI0005FA28C5|nr:L-dopachrome tautomerase-related protein [Marinomonas sp. S3726]KJZ11487.1 major royal jelly-related protein [Marinomonas sp. S3726]
MKNVKLSATLLSLSIMGTTLSMGVSAASNDKAHTAHNLKIGALEAVTQFEDYRGGGITITPEGRIIISMHPLDGPKVKVVEVMANGVKRPFPTQDWADGPEIGKVGLSAVIGVHSDSKGVVWMLDMGSEASPAKLIAWDTVLNKLSHNIELPASALAANSFLQDFVIDEKHGKIIIADMTFGNFAGATKPAFVVVDIASGQAKRVLENVDTLMPEDRDIVIEASLLASKSAEGKTTKLRFGLNPIAMDDESEWIYFGAFTGTKIYRVPAMALVNNSLSDSQIESKIEVFGPKNPSDGIAYSKQGIIVSDLENSAVGLTTKGKYQVLVQDKRLSWPDSFALSNGYVYVTQDQLHQHPAFSQGLGNAKAPYTLYRFSYQAN